MHNEAEISNVQSMQGQEFRKETSVGLLSCTIAHAVAAVGPGGVGGEGAGAGVGNGDGEARAGDGDVGGGQGVVVGVLGGGGGGSQLGMVQLPCIELDDCPAGPLSDGLVDAAARGVTVVAKGAKGTRASWRSRGA